MAIAVLPIFLTYILLIFLLIKHKLSFRSSIVFSYVILGCVIVVITELLGSLNSLNFTSILSGWLLITLPLLIYSIMLFKKIHPDINLSKHIKTYIESIKISFIKLDIISIILLFAIICIVITLGIVATFSYPNNYDAMTYHLPRIMHWLQNNNLNHYATHILRQLYTNPLSDYITLNLIVLGQNDKLANLPQYLSMIFSLIGITSIAKYLGGSNKIQIYSAFIALTIPMGLIQAPNTQNDYVVTFFIVSFILSSLILIKNTLTKQQNLFFFIISGISLGLAFLTKGTSYFFLFPFCFALLVFYFYKYQYKSILLLLILIIIPLSINAPHHMRNYNTFNNLFGPSEEIEELFTVKNISLKGFISSTLRNIGLHIQTPNEALQEFLQTGIYNIHHALNYKINDADTTIGGRYSLPIFEFKGIQINDHYTGNTLHLLLILISLLMFLKPSFRKQNKSYFIYSLLIIASFLLFCLMVKWQPFGTRLHLALFFIFSPTIAIFIAQIEKLKMKVLLSLILFLILINALPYVVLSRYRPLFGTPNIFKATKYEQYYANLRFLRKYQICGFDTLLYLRKTNIGLVLWKDHYEYPIWAKLKESNTNFTIEHVKVKNISAQYEKNNIDYVLDFSHF